MGALGVEVEIVSGSVLRRMDPSLGNSFKREPRSSGLGSGSGSSSGAGGSCKSAGGEDGSASASPGGFDVKQTLPIYV